MTITKIALQRFTAFHNLRLDLSPGVNVFVGANGTGKTHLMKVAYAACDISKTQRPFSEKLVRVFLPKDLAIGRLARRQQGVASAVAEVARKDRKIRLTFNSRASNKPRVIGRDPWCEDPIDAAYIPVKEMLANAPGFRSLYGRRDIHFEEVYADIIDRALLPVRRGPTDARRRRLLKILQGAIEGKVHQSNEEFFLRNKQGNLEFTLLAEGLRKLGLLWLLIQNGVLLDGAVLFWDEPETNLNPSLFRKLIEILLDLSRSGVQVFLATHDYIILKEFDLQSNEKDKIAFHSLHRDSESGEIACSSSSAYSGIHPNAISQAFSDVYDREVRRELGGAGRE